MARHYETLSCPKCGYIFKYRGSVEQLNIGKTLEICPGCGTIVKSNKKKELIVIENESGGLNGFKTWIIVKVLFSAIIVALLPTGLLCGISAMDSGSGIIGMYIFSYICLSIWGVYRNLNIINTSSDESIKRMQDLNYVSLLINCNLITRDQYDKFCINHDINNIFLNQNFDENVEKQDFSEINKTKSMEQPFQTAIHNLTDNTNLHSIDICKNMDKYQKIKFIIDKTVIILNNYMVTKPDIILDNNKHKTLLDIDNTIQNPYFMYLGAFYATILKIMYRNVEGASYIKSMIAKEYSLGAKIKDQKIKTDIEKGDEAFVGLIIATNEKRLYGTKDLLTTDVPMVLASNILNETYNQRANDFNTSLFLNSLPLIVSLVNDKETDINSNYFSLLDELSKEGVKSTTQNVEDPEIPTTQIGVNNDEVREIIDNKIKDENDNRLDETNDVIKEASKSDNKIKFCRNCGSELNDGAIFCSQCGKKIK